MGSVWDVKNKFLIIGVTGPLGSGCTTTAKFIKETMDQHVQDIDPARITSNIHYLYEEIHKLKVANSGSDIVQEKHEELKRLLRQRNAYLNLKEQEGGEFEYISLSRMLIKYVVEYVLNSRKRVYAQKYRQIVDSIREEGFDRKKINRVKSLVGQKKYRSLGNEECGFYDEYLQKIDSLMENARLIKGVSIGTLLQDMGDNIRKCGNPFDDNGQMVDGNIYNIAEEANNLIKYYRNRKDGGGGNRKHHFILENFRNPYEVEFFRYRYYEFYLFSIGARRSIRKNRGNFLSLRDKRDSGEGNRTAEIYKQNVSRCVYLADISIINDGTEEDLYNKVAKYYSLILMPGSFTPESDEMFMHQAYSMSLKSSCVSRQVGAIIVGRDGYVVGAGWNDAGEGQVGCGYRQVIDVERLSNEVLPISPPSEGRLRRQIASKKPETNSFCYKDEISQYNLAEKFRKFITGRGDKLKKVLSNPSDVEMLRDWLVEDIKIKRLEYCRALHAEENALLQSTKIGSVGVAGGKIYTTSFPCELCAKKIHQAGIDEVIYVEPYPESISQDVFFKDGLRYIKLRQFEGVRSHSYYRLYKPSTDKKEMQDLREALA